MNYPEISIIVPVYSESNVISTLIHHLQELKYKGEYEIIIVDGHPENTTLQIIQSNASIRKISSQKGRALQMNRGAGIAEGEILLFVHADTYLPENGLNVIARKLCSRKIVGGAFRLGIDSSHPGLKIIEIVANNRTNLTRIPYGDQAIFIKKDYFHEFGGYKNIPLMEDVELMRRIKRRGDQIIIIGQKTRTSPRRWIQQGITYCTLRNWIIYMLYSFGVEPEKLIKFY